MPVSDETYEAMVAARKKRDELYAKELPAWTLEEITSVLTGRYKASEIPPCKVCGGKLSPQKTGGGEPDEWACSVYEDDPEKPGYVRNKADRTEGIVDNHYVESRYIDRRQGGDELVMEALRRLSVPTAAGPWIINDAPRDIPTTPALVQRGLGDLLLFLPGDPWLRDFGKWAAIHVPGPTWEPLCAACIRLLLDAHAALECREAHDSGPCAACGEEKNAMFGDCLTSVRSPGPDTARHMRARMSK